MPVAQIWCPIMIFLIAAVALLLATPATAQDTTEVVVVATTDVHGHVMHWDYVNNREAPWGLTRAATVLDSLRSVHRDRVILVDAGDLIQGNPYAYYFATNATGQINPITDAFNALGYDAMVLGNHEFNFGLDVLSQTLSEANFQVLGANVVQTDGSRAFPAYAMVRRGAARIGIAGFTTPGAMVWDRANLEGRTHIRPIMDVAAQTLRQMEDAGATVKIVIVHSGLDGPSSYADAEIGPENVAAQFADLDVKPDLVVLGHTHRVLEDSVINGVHFVQPNRWARSLAVVHVTIVVDAEGNRSTSIRGEQIDLATVEPQAQLTRSLRLSHETVRRWVESPLAAVRGDWSAQFARAQDTPVIDFVNRIQQQITGAQLSSTAAFNTSVSFGPDVVRLGDIAGIYPYENTLKAVLIDGRSLKTYLERSASYFRTFSSDSPIINEEIPGYNYDIVSGIDYTIDLSRPVGDRIQDISFDGRPVRPSDTFTLALNNYRQGGGGGFEMLEDLPIVYDRGQNIRDLLVEAARAAGMLDATAYFEDSWRIVPEVAASAVRAAFGAEEPSETTTLRILLTAGFSDAFEADSTAWSQSNLVGGVESVQGWMDRLERECSCATIRLNAGNTLLGGSIATLTHGGATIEAFNSMNVAASVAGVGDLRWGADTVSARSAEANFDLLSVNISIGDDDSPPEWATAWTGVRVGDLTVNVIGLTLPSMETGSDSAIVLREALPALQQVLPSVRSSHAELVVLLTNGTLQCAEGRCMGDLQELASALDSADIDLILAHSEPPLSATINGIPIVAVGDNGTRLGVVDFRRRRDGSLTVRTEFQPTWVDSVVPDSQFTAMVTRHRAAAAEILNREVATLRVTLIPSAGESPLGRLIADAVRNTARAPIAIIPNSVISDGLPGGTVTYADVMQAVSPEIEIVRIAVTGRRIQQVFELMLSEDDPSGQISGLQVTYDPEKRVGRRVKRITLLDGSRIRNDNAYFVAVPSTATATGNENTFFPGVRSQGIGTSLAEGLATYLGRIPQPIRVPQNERFIADR